MIMIIIFNIKAHVDVARRHGPTSDAAQEAARADTLSALPAS
jgi:hypothetical protein